MAGGQCVGTELGRTTLLGEQETGPFYKQQQQQRALALAVQDDGNNGPGEALAMVMLNDMGSEAHLQDSLARAVQPGCGSAEEALPKPSGDGHPLAADVLDSFFNKKDMFAGRGEHYCNSDL